MTGLLCEWCGKPLTGRQEVACNDIHKLKAWRWKHQLPAGLQGIERPPEGSPLLRGVRAVQTAPAGADNGSRVSNGGLQVSVGRLLVVLQGEPFYITERWARRLVARALSERQLERFEVEL